jgi:uncharacterized protein DUF2188
MMKRGGGIHTVPDPDGKGWANEEDGKTLSHHRTKEAAVDAGRAAAKREAVEHTIHKLDGTIGERNSYGNDPNPPKG